VKLSYGQNRWICRREENHLNLKGKAHLAMVSACGNLPLADGQAMGFPSP
jgi:hypothetical protein